MLRAVLVTFLGSILAASTTLLAGLRQRICMYAYTVNAQMHLFLPWKCMRAFAALRAEGLVVFCRRKKARAMAGVSYVRRLTGVHAPPEHMTEDADLLILDILETVVLVRVFIAIEAAQANPGRQAVELFHP